jgi:hypothetical protein
MSDLRSKLDEARLALHDAFAVGCEDAMQASTFSEGYRRTRRAYNDIFYLTLRLLREIEELQTLDRYSETLGSLVR